VTTIAPTGTISMIAGCSGGIEPIYAVAFKRNQAGMDVVDVHPEFERDLKGYLEAALAQPPVEKAQYDEIVQWVLDNGSLDNEKIPDILKEWYRTSADVTPKAHVHMQSVWQRHVCSAISKTINLQNKATLEDVKDAYWSAWEKKCKGVTVYRDGSRPEQVLSTGKTDDTARLRVETMDEGSAERVTQDRGWSKRPEVLNGRTHRVDSPIGGMYVTVNRHPETDSPYEVFVTVGKAGGTTPSFSEAIGRLISLNLRNNVDLKEVHKQLRGISSDRSFGFGNGKVASGPDAVAKVLEEYIGGRQEQVPETSKEFAACPDCHAELTFSEGCYKCHACGYGGC
jgi:ribonucleoside-diphosphate reductase alpha chain